MTTTAYQASLAEYVGQLEGFLATAAEQPRQLEAVSPDDLVAQADELSRLSSDLTAQTTDFLEADDVAVRLGAEQHLLAQAMANLQVADRLLASAVAVGEADAPSVAGDRALATTIAPMDDVIALLQAPLTETAAQISTAGMLRQAGLPQATPTEVVETASDAMDHMVDGVVDFGKDTVAGLLGLDTALLKQAAALISKELGDLVEQLGDQVSRLVAKAVEFIVQAYDSILAALGQDVTNEMRQQISQWLEALREGETLSGLLDKVYEVQTVQQRVASAVGASDASPTVMAQVRDSIDALPGQFDARTKLSRQLLAGLGLIKRFPVTRVPMVELISAALYLALLGYAVYVGGDFVDAPKLERLGRIPGVVHVVETGLAGA